MSNAYKLIGGGLKQECTAALYARRKAKRGYQYRPKVKEPDELILLIRGLREHQELAISQIIKYVSIGGTKLTESRVWNIVQYTTRVHLIPEKP